MIAGLAALLRVWLFAALPKVEGLAHEGGLLLFFCLLCAYCHDCRPVQIGVALLDKNELVEELFIARLSAHAFCLCTGDLSFADDKIAVSLLLEAVEIVDGFVMRSESPLGRE